MYLLVNSTKYLRKKFKEQIIHNVFQKTEAERILPNSFYEYSITLILKWDKNITRMENNSPILLMNTAAKILNKILSNLIQQCIRRIIKYEQVWFIPGMQGWINIWISISVTHHNRIMKKQNTQNGQFNVEGKGLNHRGDITQLQDLLS